MPTAEEEAHMVADLLGCQPLAGPAATKERVMSALTQAECAHFATHISWKLAALVLTPTLDAGSGSAAPAPSGGSGSGEGKSNYTIPESLRVQDDGSDAESICDSPPLQEFLLTAADILDLRLPTKLVVLGSVTFNNIHFHKTTGTFLEISSDVLHRKESDTFLKVHLVSKWAHQLFSYITSV